MAEKSTAFAVIGDRFHNSDYIRTALGKTLVRDLGLTIDFTDEIKLLSAETLRGYKILITFRDGMIWPQGYGAGGALPPNVSEPPVPEVEATAIDWIAEPQAQAVKDFVEGGGAALFYHNSTYIARGNATFRAVLGAATEGHPPVRPFKVTLTDPNHPITEGASDFIVTDEQHYMTYDGDPADVFMRSINEDGLTFNELGVSCEAGWAYDYGKGRICYLAPGHTVAALWNPAYETIQQNAVRWLLREI